MPVNPIIREDLETITGADLPWEALSGSTILITGAAGFLPAYMVETVLHLNQTRLAQPARVLALVRNRQRAEQRFADYLDRPDFELIVQDVTEPFEPAGNIDYIVHAASQASPRYYRTDPVGTLSANILGTSNLLGLARRCAVKSFLFFSSGDVYGTVGSAQTSVAEHDYGYLDPTDVRSCYGESKRMGETMCVSWAHQFGIPVRIVRPFHTYGPGMRLDDGRVFADFVRDILAGGPITLHSDGSARRCFCYLADATAGFFAVLLKGASGEAFNVANPEAESSIAGLADRLARIYAEAGIGVERKERTDSVYSPSPIHATLPDINKIRLLGWTPATGIEQGFRRTVESYRV